MKTDTTLRLGRVEYRRLAELAKQACCCLSLGTVREMGGNWGLFSPWGMPIHSDAQSEDPRMAEKIVIQLAHTVDAGHLRSVQRPEIDWGQLEDHEVFEFIAQHEMGHRVDNYGAFDVLKIQDIPLRDQCMKLIATCNEVLADRYAWEAIRPGEAVPLCETGRRYQEEVATAMALLDEHMPRTRRTAQALPALAAGQYRYVPQSMLATTELAAFVGPHVAPGLMERARERRRVHRRDTRTRVGAFA